MSETTIDGRDRIRSIAGWVLGVVACAPFVPSAAFKLMKNPQAIEGLGHLGLSPTGVVILGVVELLVAVVYLIPATAVLGAVLITGYVGGIVIAHLTFHLSLWIPIAIGVAVWLGLWLRDARLRALLPLRSQ